MAPIRDCTTLQADITLPPTIPLILSHLSSPGAAQVIRKADLVICDGSPDITGVHDLDAYLHSQLLLAAITLTLTILRRGGTAVYKIFLSPMDPRGEMLKSQLGMLFGGQGEGGELDLDFDADSDAQITDGLEVQVDKRSLDTATDGDVDMEGGPVQSASRVEDARRRRGVWVCKPRSSRGQGGELLSSSPRGLCLTLCLVRSHLIEVRSFPRL